MIKIVVVPADPLLPVRVADVDETNLRDAQTVGGGPGEPIDLARPGATLYASKHDELDVLARNDRATLLAWVHAPELRGHIVLAGDAYLTGPLRGGVPTDAPGDLVAVLTGAVPGQAETLSRRDRRWSTVPRPLDTAYAEPFDVYAVAILTFLLDDPDTLDVRVIPASKT